VAFPAGASYVTAAGEIGITGYNDMQGILEAIDALFTAAHPGFRFKLSLIGTKAGAGALTRGASAFAPMGAEFYEEDVAGFRRAFGSYPIVFPVAHDSLNARALSSPIAIVVNRANPLEVLTTDQVARIFTVGSARGPLDDWGQAKLPGEWAGRPMHPVGMGLDTALGTFMQKHKFGGRPFGSGVALVARATDVAKRVAADPLAIGFSVLNAVTPEVKAVAIAEPGGRPSRGTAEDIVAGRYPYDRELLIYARQPLEPYVREYLRLIYSREGQGAIAAEARGYLPLSAADAARERARLDD
jgi:phosphate transport system substrate-binding protein